MSATDGGHDINLDPILNEALQRHARRSLIKRISRKCACSVRARKFEEFAVALGTIQ